MSEQSKPSTIQGPPRIAQPNEAPKPLYTVWELTMHCDQPCTHCGSRAGSPRSEELNTAQVLDVADALGRLGCREVALIGGEAYLRKDLHQVVERLSQHGIRVSMQTGGRAFTKKLAESLRTAGLSGVGVSIDGLQATHDRLRGNVGSFEAALRALDAANDAGLTLSANSQINRLNEGELEDLFEIFWQRNVRAWQLQWTVAMGRAADHPEWLIQPWQVVGVIDRLGALQLEAARRHTTGPIFNVCAGNNIGYYGPHEHVLRSIPGTKVSLWGGCSAGTYTLGIESDGTVKGCPSLPTAPYAGGNVRDIQLEQLWQDKERIGFTRGRGTEDLWGYCSTCYYAETCRGGCNWTAHCTLGKRGNNPFCYHRARDLKKKGLRERLVKVEAAPDLPYDFGRFEIVEEPHDSPEPPVRKRLNLLS